MRGRWFIAALAVVLLGAVPGMEAIRGQQGAAGTNGGSPSTNGGAASTNGTDAKPKPAKVGSYSLVVTTLEPTRKNEGQIAIGLLPAGLCTGDPIPPEVAGSLRVR
jgi:hypothetical protein